MCQTAPSGLEGERAGLTHKPTFELGSLSPVSGRSFMWAVRRPLAACRSSGSRFKAAEADLSLLWAEGGARTSKQQSCG